MATTSDSFPGTRICQVICLKRADLEEYKRLHEEVWDSVLDALRRAHIVDYSVHLLPSPPFALGARGHGLAGLLIATFKYTGQDFDGDMARVAEATRWWGELTDVMQLSLVEGATSSADRGWWFPCEEVFRFDK